jgi:hypothetical protein
MDQPARGKLVPLPETKVKIFDPHDGFGAITSIRAFTDATVFKRENQWWMIGAGFDVQRRAILLFSASLPANTPLAAKSWKITTAPNDPTIALALVPPSSAGAWDGVGGLHCPSYVRGWDPTAEGAGAWRERIYYAGSSVSFAGPYTIGYLEWHGSEWIRYGDSPVLTATEPWETPTVAEPNVIYHNGKWRVWYLAGPDASNRYLQGYAESADGKTNWSKRVFLPGEENIFDHAVIAANGRYESVFARLPSRPDDGAWWRSADLPYPEAERWGEPSRLLSPLDAGSEWHAAGVWKPSLQYSDSDPTRAFVFFDGGYPAAEGSYPVFTLGCIECRLVT